MMPSRGKGMPEAMAARVPTTRRIVSRVVGSAVKRRRR